jgi:membrane protein
MKNRGKRALQFVWDTGNEFFNDRCPSMAAAISYYTFFSLPPLLFLLLMLLGTFLDPEDVRGAILEQIRSLIGRAGTEQVQIILEQADQPGRRLSIATLVGFVALGFGATTAFAELQAALNRAWGVEPDPARGTIRNFLVKRVFSFGLVLVIAFLLLVSLVLSAGLVAFGDFLGTQMGELSKVLLQALSLGISFGVFSLLFAAMFKVIPDAEIAWKDVRIGALITTLLFMLGKVLLGLYLGGADPGDAYGAAGSLAVIMIWVYYSSMILLLGAEFTRGWAERYGGGIQPSEGAVQVVEERRPIRRGNGE